MYIPHEIGFHYSGYWPVAADLHACMHHLDERTFDEEIFSHYYKSINGTHDTE